LSGSRRKIAQIDTNLHELNASTRNLAESLAKDTETDKLADELTKIKSNSALGGASNDDLKLLKQDVRTLTNDVAKVSAQVDDLKDLRRLEGEMASLKNDVDKHADELSLLNRNVTSVDDDLTRQNDQIGRTNQRVESLSESLNTQNGKLEGLTNLVEKLLEKKKNKPAGS
jgi:chromosome segregation ATPase